MKKSPISYRVKHTRLEVIKLALYYLLAESNQLLSKAKKQNFTYVEIYEIRISIATALYYSYEEKLSKRFPNETYRLRLELHDAIVIEKALIKYETYSDNEMLINQSAIMRTDINGLIANAKNDLNA